MRILGINCLNHDAAMAVVDGQDILWAAHAERYSKIKGHEGLRKDELTGAIINVDRSAWQAARERAKAAQKSRDEIRDQARQINNLKCEMHEIKSMLQTLLDR